MKPQNIARRLRPIIEKAVISLEDEFALQAVELFPHWDENGHTYYNGADGEHPQDRVSYGETLYKCITTHDSQSSWTPAVSPSLWVRVDNPAEEWPEWIQPVGSTDAYEYGAKVSHNSKHWISTYEGANVWEPGVYGWSEQS